ncbi:hypothetical protein Z043_114801 [Scleropages formosus]|uniref:Receptor ligand binding region domain-containing protein n=1 Tax=Scleropages formosus TaxID=113540 RepID=A0A0P7V2N7_SCLFO|nr:hypothetical protein Z043_114801 [Scleropages formosus]
MNGCANNVGDCRGRLDVQTTKSLCSLPDLRQESGSIFLQFSCSAELQLQVIFELMEEYDWTSFSVVSTRHHGYQDFLAIIEGITDGSFIGWERRSVVMLNLTDDPGGARARRQLKENEAQVRLLYCSQEEAELVFKAAWAAGQAGPSHMWFTVGPALAGLGLEGLPKAILTVRPQGWRDEPRRRIAKGVSVLAHGAVALRKDYGSLESGFTDDVLRCCAALLALFACLRYFSNITLGGRDYSFNSDGYLANPYMDVISHSPGKGWEEILQLHSSIGKVESVKMAITAEGALLSAQPLLDEALHILLEIVLALSPTALQAVPSPVVPVSIGNPAGNP